MSLHWPYFALTIAFALIAAGMLAMMRLEQRTGQAHLFFWKPSSWQREASPSLFRTRIASYWVGILIFGLAALADFAGFLGIIG